MKKKNCKELYLHLDYKEISKSKTKETRKAPKDQYIPTQIILKLTKGPTKEP